MRQIEPRLFVALVGGAAGTFASLGDRAREVQDGVAKRLGLAPMPIPSRSIVDHFAEFVCRRLASAEHRTAENALLQLSDGQIRPAAWPAKNHAQYWAACSLQASPQNSHSGSNGEVIAG